MISEIILTEMDSIGEIGLINLFATILLFNDDVHRNALAEIVHDQSGKDFLHCGGIRPRARSSPPVKSGMDPAIFFTRIVDKSTF